MGKSSFKKGGYVQFKKDYLIHASDVPYQCFIPKDSIGRVTGTDDEHFINVYLNAGEVFGNCFSVDKKDASTVLEVIKKHGAELPKIKIKLTQVQLGAPAEEAGPNLSLLVIVHTPYNVSSEQALALLKHHNNTPHSIKIEHIISNIVIFATNAPHAKDIDRVLDSVFPGYKII